MPVLSSMGFHRPAWTSFVASGSLAETPANAHICARLEGNAGNGAKLSYVRAVQLKAY